MLRFIAAGFLVCAPAFAQEATVVVPSAFASPQESLIQLSLRDTRDTPLQWNDAQVSWSLIRIAGTQENSDHAPRADENAPAGTVRLAAQGAAVIGVDFTPRIVPLSAEAMKAFPNAPAKLPEGATPVRLIQSAKTIIRSGAAQPGQSANVTAKTGQQVELRPTFDPTGVGIGSDVPVVVYAGEGKVPGAKLTATHIASGEKQEFTANDSAIGSFRLSRPGAWRIEFRHLAPLKNRKEGDPAWVLYTATLTFEAPAAQEAGK